MNKNKKSIFTYNDFTTNNIVVLNMTQFSTTTGYIFCGIEHALTVDFTKDNLVDLLGLIKPSIADFILKELAKTNCAPRVIYLEENIVVGLKAHLGKLIKVSSESFIPLIVNEFFETGTIDTSDNNPTTIILH